jgi:hypothetical protein
MRHSTTITGLVMIALAGLVAAVPAVAQDPLGVKTTGGGPTPVVESLLGTAILVSSCPLPTGSSVGLTWDGSHLWVSDFSTRRAYRLDPTTCSIVSSFALPGSFPTGLAWDGTSLWNSDSGSDRYYQINPSNGSVVSSFASPGIWPSGLTHHAGNLWGADINCTMPVCPDQIDEVSGLGVVLDTFFPPGPLPAGLASDGVNIWHSDNSLDTIYKVNPVNFSVLDQFPAPGNLTNDLAWDGRYLWAIEAAADRLYKFDVGVPLLPRSQGFWTHQCSDNGFQQVSAAELDALFADIESQSAAFPECAALGCGRFEKSGPKNDILPKALTHLQVAWLNVVSDRLISGTAIDLAGLTGAATVGEALDEVEAAVCDRSSSRADLALAKDIAEALSNSTVDFDLGNTASIVPVQAGERGTVTVGVINMSSIPRSYDLTVTGPWQVQISDTRINALAPGGIALVTVSSDAPLSAAPGSTAAVRIFAQDSDNQLVLKRDLTLTFRVPGSGGGGSKRMLPPD